jgi:hypothetical protein
MDAATIQDRIYRGYGKAAQRIGFAHDVFRATTANDPTDPARKIATIKAAFDAATYSFTRPNKYGTALWNGLFDGRTTQVGDYLTGPGGTYFVAAQQHLEPILAVECNRTIAVHRPQQQTGVGALPYGGNDATTETALASGWPASVLQGTKGEVSGARLPGDVRSPWWLILVPAIPGVTVNYADIIVDEFSRRFVVSSAELTDLGWRLTASQAEP